jgi:hypothetical protein
MRWSVWPKTLTVAAHNAHWDGTTFSYGCCGYNHTLDPCVGSHPPIQRTRRSVNGWTY